jgi:hypothetical protein
MSARELGVVIVALGALAIVIGLLVASGALGWFGRLPGDLRFEGSDGRVRVYAPLVSMLLLSVLATVVINLLRRWLG